MFTLDTPEWPLAVDSNSNMDNMQGVLVFTYAVNVMRSPLITLFICSKSTKLYGLLSKQVILKLCSPLNE